jgi:hypothetical protein
MVTRTVGAIALRPTGNYQGSYIIFSLNTRRTMIRNRWNILPVPDKVTKRVETMASRKNDYLT